MQPGLSSVRLLLEPQVTSHADEMFLHLQNPALYTYIPSDVPQNLVALRLRYTRQESRRSPDGSEAWLNWIVRLKGSIGSDKTPCIGFVQATVCLQEKTALVAYTVFQEFWRHGYAKEALTSMLDHLFAHYDLSAAEALIDTRNIASTSLVEAVGFTQVEFLPQADFFKGEHSDEYRYRLDRSPISNSA
ncbi:GNAT family N-acetyltransferase [Glaciimonas soli]|uniref:GNAT family N-acetyltransferase n=1 Tax=Glaciimonas soli TaxID=2590999 RepID=A0A843YPF1_9BURK|nr:GNAT family N-acetyltransferase [Glaciimonas soli]MQQ99856.1 GNAT family N-acetyltransferase [Glaciimonas soli]